MQRGPFIGIIGPAKAEPEILQKAEACGFLLARRGTVIICGGLSGVMEAASKGAKSGGGITVGILPGETKESANPFIDIPIATGAGEARNVFIVRSADGFIAIGGGYGTLSEIALALKAGKPVIGISTWDINGVIKVNTPEEAVEKVFELLSSK